MTLERHKSHLIPEVQYSLDGTLFVTDVGGTFPLRGKASKHSDIRDHDFGDVSPPPTFRSFDLRREDLKRRYKQRRSSSREGTSTLSNNASSLGRRLRRSKRKSEFSAKEKYFSSVENGSMSTPSSGRRIHSGPPQMTPEFADSLRIKSLRDSKAGTGSLKRGRRSDIDANSYQYRLSNGSEYEKKARYHKIHDEKLPYLLFLIDGILLMITGVVRILLSYWHEYYSSIIAGILLMILGILGTKHKGMYLAKGISGVYILFALLNGITMIATSGLILYVFIPMVLMLSEDLPPADIITNIKFTSMNKSLAGINITPSAMIWSSLALDIGSLTFIFLGFYTMTAAMVAISNHWDACYDTTADCDHRGNPRLFNPIEQVVMGVASTFVGLVYIAAVAGFIHISHNHYYAPIWSSTMGTFASFIEILAFLTCSAAIVLTTLGIVNDVNGIQESSDKTTAMYKELLGIIVIGSVLDLILVIDVIFIVGTLFRQFRQVCCRNCGG
ncbi:hypothetical protein LSH36_15g15038 [Paralvinella palmiformis]|uniref:Uncharacterized protein n=1 Tax=Paralvinella palmiformis TaxID=53620 RepID=A0AAD9KCG0_9ANNE|nr:hypothetical protein LSH36_15g15038 [Paralvinella palmiformis]